MLASPGTAEAFLASADRVLHLDVFAAGGCLARTPPEVAEPAPPLDRSRFSLLTPDPGTQAERRAMLLALVRRQLEEASGPVSLAAIASALHATCTPWVKISAYGGAGTFMKLVQGGEDWVHAPGPSGGWLFDAARHEPPPLQAD